MVVLFHSENHLLNFYYDLVLVSVLCKCPALHYFLLIKTYPSIKPSSIKMKKATAD